MSSLFTHLALVLFFALGSIQNETPLILGNKIDRIPPKIMDNKIFQRGQISFKNCFFLDFEIKIFDQNKGNLGSGQKVGEYAKIV